MICKEIFPLIKIKALKSVYIPCGNISTKHKSQHDGDQIMNRQGKHLVGTFGGTF